VQLIADVLTNRAQNEHISPVINRLVGRRGDIAKIFDTSAQAEFWKKNFVVVSLDKVNLDMRKTIPLLLAKKLYQDHKQHRNTKSLTIIIDEAHNILSTESFRESESWKDYRLETFEEIIKEGRKFGVFVTISSQRPNDISPTITSQAHNYFIHRLVNQRDLATISSAVSYIDKVSEASIPTLPIGTCIFSGVAGQMPLKLRVRPLEEHKQPRSNTLRFSTIVE
ncbi:MAG: ATP-binding protein, partial [Hyphomicrobium sp.]|nr:ATP-binding protein [Hyphomicrobium sp.]